MDPRVTLLKAFYAGMPKDRLKVETREYGFAFLDTLLSDGATLEYGELTLTESLHKYKLAHVPPRRFDELLRAHVEKRCNVCLYFDTVASNLLCFNLDNNHKTGNTALIPELEFAVRFIREQLTRLACEPLIVASGRGYHLWCRLDTPVASDRLYDFMLRVSVHTMAALQREGRDHRQIKINVYPDRRIRDVVSLRLFGSDHAKNKIFSRVLSGDRLLDEAESWSAFEDHLERRIISKATFDAALASLNAAEGPLALPFSMGDAIQAVKPHGGR